MTSKADGSGSYLESVVQAIDELRGELVETSLDIHAHPELNYEENHAAAVLAEVRAQHPLERHGTFPVKAPMPGLVKEVFVQQGETVAKGQRLLVLEAMKMNNEIRSPQDGIVKALPIVREQRVNMGDLLVLLE